MVHPVVTPIRIKTVKMLLARCRRLDVLLPEHFITFRHSILADRFLIVTKECVNVIVSHQKSGDSSPSHANSLAGILGCIGCRLTLHVPQLREGQFSPEFIRYQHSEQALVLKEQRSS